MGSFVRSKNCILFAFSFTPGALLAGLFIVCLAQFTVFDKQPHLELFFLYDIRRYDPASAWNVVCMFIPSNQCSAAVDALHVKPLCFFKSLFYFAVIHFSCNAPAAFYILFFVFMTRFKIFMKQAVLFSIFGHDLRCGNRHAQSKAVYLSIFSFKRILPLYALFPELLYLFFRVFHSFHHALRFAYKRLWALLFFGGFFIVRDCGRALSALPKQEQFCILSQFPYTFGI